MFQLSKRAYVDVDKRLFEKYIEEKANPLIGALEQNMYIGMFDWSTCYPLTGLLRTNFLSHDHWLLSVFTESSMNIALIDTCHFHLKD